MNSLIPREFIDELLRRIDIVDLIDAYVPLKKRGQNHIACCPFHQEKTPSFNVIPKKQFYHCFGCGASGNIISFIMNYHHQTFPQAIETLAMKAGLTIPREENPEQHKKISLQEVLHKVSVWYQHLLRQPDAASAVAYLKQRGVDGHIAKHYQLGYAPKGWHALAQHFTQHQAALVTTGMLILKENSQTYDRYRHRIIFPIHNRHGKIIGFGGRAIEPDQQPKYLNSPETPLFQKGRELYGLYQAIQQDIPLPYVYIVEGYLDVIALAQHGIRNVVATLGTATSNHHIQLLSKYTQRLIFCFDGDNAGRQAAWRALESSLMHLDGTLQAAFMFLPEGHDPDSYIRAYGKSEFENRSQSALSWHQFFFNTLLTDIPQTDLAGKSQLIHMAKPYLNKMQDSPYKTLLIEEIARFTHIESHRIEQLLQDHPSPQSAAKTPITVEPITRTPKNIALALLIQHPDIIRAHLPDEFTIEADSEYTLLARLIKDLKTHEIGYTATLVEHYRESIWFDTIHQLATLSHAIPEHAIASEWMAILAFINKKQQENQIQQWIDKSRKGTLTAAERQTLQNMLQARHQPNTEGKG